MSAFKYCVFLIILVVFLSCKKTTIKLPDDPPLVNTDMANGFTNDPESINGHCYFSYSGDPNSGGYLYAHGAFRDPAGNIMASYNHATENQSFLNGTNDNIFGNIDLGQVTVNGLSLFKSNNTISISYGLNNSSFGTTFNFKSAWRTAGNGSFKAIDLAVPRGFPQFTYPANLSDTYTISVSHDLTINLASLVSNFDSVIICLGYIQSLNSLKKSVSSNVSSVTFTKAELQQFNNSSGGGTQMYFMAFNYSNKTIDSKVYVFEQANKFTRYASLVP